MYKYNNVIKQMNATRFNTFQEFYVFKGALVTTKYYVLHWNGFLYIWKHFIFLFYKILK